MSLRLTYLNPLLSCLKYLIVKQNYMLQELQQLCYDMLIEYARSDAKMKRVHLTSARGR